MIQELFKAFILIFIAEMGDKTQILAMAFATKFPVRKVLMGIFIGSLLNHGLAVLFGNYLSTLIPISTLQIIGGLAFIGFALWTLQADDEEEEENIKYKFGPIFTVSMAFFIGELGDKTQLTAITLATEGTFPILILTGTVLGMVLTGGIGILIGKKIGDKIPEITIKIIASSVFMIFGIIKLYQNLPREYVTPSNSILFVTIIVLVGGIMLKSIIINKRLGNESVLKRHSRDLYQYYQEAKENIEEICLGVDECVTCQGEACPIGITKTLIHNGLTEKKEINHKKSYTKDKQFKKQYDKEKVSETLKVTIKYLRKLPCPNQYQNIHEIRKKLEMILFDKCIEDFNDWKEYEKLLIALDEDNVTQIF
ncbi:putative Ca2+/H+ antiporter (TMEM165/GDT1 family) [Natranaerovirga hydrolytica]|uniref:GDT1 family protein n=1 Tax=Natranaerovirga hydrolytica TaxID=680378 RepID=A0A4R1MZH1_9FIRM|nr:TMEM165/GDT1 family protein [Natranaerovirga hydrolytica]TCK98738.1 putative Ca2+/H+ antiporter (TMEM165/GDT1 family) [Natranaerovirga hydrolytica]